MSWTVAAMRRGLEEMGEGVGKEGRCGGSPWEEMRDHGGTGGGRVGVKMARRVV